MSLLDDLRTNIADEAPAPSGAVLIPQSCVLSILDDLRVDIADDSVSSSGAIVVGGCLGDTTVVQNLTVQGDLEICGAQYWGTRTIVDPGDVTINDSDNVVLINKTIGEATTVTIPLPGTSGKARLLIIKDMKGDASVNNIRIISAAGTIDGQNVWILNQNYQSFTLIDNGTEWNII